MLCMSAQVLAHQPEQWPILVDPQTGGGLLAGLPADHAAAALQVNASF